MATVKRVATCTAAAPLFHEADRVAAGENAARRDHRNIQLFRLQIGDDFGHDRAQIVFRPVHAETEMAARKRAFDHDEIGQPVGSGILAQEQSAAHAARKR